MPIVNYVLEHTRFIEYASDEGLSSSERLLWYALMHCMNQRAQGNVWPDEFIRIGNDRLLLLTPMKFDSLAKARNGLKQRGLIEFVPGDKNKKPPQYRMIYFYPKYVAPATDKDGAESNPKKTDNYGYNMGYNHGDNHGDNHGGNVGDIYINNTIDGTIPQLNQDQEEDDETNNITSHTRERIRQAWKSAYGKEPSPAMLEAVLFRGVSVCHFDLDVVCEAVKMAALRGADSPVDYILKLFRDWDRQKIRNVDDLEIYLDGEIEA